MWDLVGLGEYKLLLDNLIVGLSCLGLGLLEGMSWGTRGPQGSLIKRLLSFQVFLPFGCRQIKLHSLIIILGRVDFSGFWSIPGSIRTAILMVYLFS